LNHDSMNIGSADTAVLNGDVYIVFIGGLRLEVDDLELCPALNVVHGVSFEFEFGRHVVVVV